MYINCHYFRALIFYYHISSSLTPITQTHRSFIMSWAAKQISLLTFKVFGVISELFIFLIEHLIRVLEFHKGASVSACLSSVVVKRDIYNNFNDELREVIDFYCYEPEWHLLAIQDWFWHFGYKHIPDSLVKIVSTCVEYTNIYSDSLDWRRSSHPLSAFLDLSKWSDARLIQCSGYWLAVVLRRNQTKCWHWTTLAWLTWIIVVPGKRKARDGWDGLLRVCKYSHC